MRLRGWPVNQSLQAIDWPEQQLNMQNGAVHSVLPSISSERWASFQNLHPTPIGNHAMRGVDIKLLSTITLAFAVVDWSDSTWIFYTAGHPGLAQGRLLFLD